MSDQHNDTLDAATKLLEGVSSEDRVTAMARSTIRAFLSCDASPSEILTSLFMSVGEILEYYFDESDWNAIIDKGIECLHEDLNRLPDPEPQAEPLNTISGFNLVCPYCSYAMDSVTEAEGKNVKPSPGDASVCFNCAQILVFDNNLNLIIPLPDLLKHLAQNETLNRIAEGIRNRDRRSPEERKATAQT